MLGGDLYQVPIVCLGFISYSGMAWIYLWWSRRRRYCRGPHPDGLDKDADCSPASGAGLNRLLNPGQCHCCGRSLGVVLEKL